MDQIINRVRFFHFITGILVNQKNDPYCSICKAATNTAARMKEEIAQLEKDCSSVRERLLEATARMLDEAVGRSTTLHFPEDAAGQKKAGNCRLPEGVCFVKNSKALLEKI